MSEDLGAAAYEKEKRGERRRESLQRRKYQVQEGEGHLRKRTIIVWRRNRNLGEGGQGRLANAKFYGTMIC